MIASNKHNIISHQHIAYNATYHVEDIISTAIDTARTVLMFDSYAALPPTYTRALKVEWLMRRIGYHQIVFDIIYSFLWKNDIVIIVHSRWVSDTKTF